MSGLGDAGLPHNPRHSSKKQDWGTPPWIAEIAHNVLDGIDLDPATSGKANKIIQAECYFTEKENGLRSSLRWCGLRRPSSIWLNPPGGLVDDKGRLVAPKCRETGSCGLKAWEHDHEGIESSVKRWWLRLLKERKEKYVGHGLFLSFSIEAMQVTQVGCAHSILDFPTVVFKKRLNFIDPATGEIVQGNTHSSCLTYIPGRVNRTAYFIEKFQDHGQVIVPARRMP